MSATGENSGTFRFEVREDGVGVVTIDVPGQSQNTLKDEFNDAFESLLGTIESDERVRAVVLISGKPDSFIAGADIKMLARVKTATEAAALSARGQRTFARLAASRVPIIAAIHGPALGGGLELALACHARVCTDAPGTQLGLPESQIGLLPGAGGTQRLPRLVGVAAALDMMLTGKRVRPRAARKMGLVDEVVPHPVLLEAAAARALRLADAPAPATGPLAGVQRGFAQMADAGGAQAIALEANPLGRKVLFAQARKQLLRKTRGNYPAQERIIDAVEAGYARGEAFGYEAESRFFGELVVSPEAGALIGIFEATTALKKDSGVDDPTVEPRDVRRLGMLGAGLMGAGIAYVTVEKADVDVRLKDQDDAGLARGLAQVWKSYERALARRRTTRQQAERQMHRVTATTGYDGIERCDVVVEAVPEILELKHRVLRDVEAITDETTIFASNTSSIPIARIAEASRRPETVIGMHYFSPVEKMPLLEIIVTPETAPWVTATAVALGKRQGKTVIVVGDGPGFYTSRILSPYLNEAAYLLTEGVPVDGLDEALVRWGFPVGPLTLLDEVGVDVASKVGPIMVDAFGPRMEPPGTTEILVEDGRLGRKSKKGFYQYDGAKKGKRAVDESIYTLLGVTPRVSFDAEAVVERCALAMVNEAARCLEEGILRSARDGDVGAVFGLGFPPFRGGPFRYVDAVGARGVVERLDRLRAEHGLRFEAAEILRAHARTGRPLLG